MGVQIFRLAVYKYMCTTYTCVYNDIQVYAMVCGGEHKNECHNKIFIKNGNISQQNQRRVQAALQLLYRTQIRRACAWFYQFEWYFRSRYTMVYNE